MLKGQEDELRDLLQTAATLLHLNGFAWGLLVVHLEGQLEGKPLGELTLNQLKELDMTVSQRYNTIFGEDE